MRKTMLGSLTSLLIPFAAYAAPMGYGAYQRRQPVHLASHLPLSPIGQYKLRPESPIEVDNSELTIFPGSSVKELIIIDSAVPDKAVLSSATRPGIETVILQSSADALEQTAALLRNYHNLEAVHLVSHGEAGAILLGGQRIDKDTLETQPQFLAALGAATRAGADLLLYACDLASEDSELLELIQQNTHLDVAASNNLTGAAGLGGDWILEIHAGNIEVAQAFSEKALKDFSAVLRPFGTKTFESWGNYQIYSDDPSRDWDGFTTYISTVGTYAELLSGQTCGSDLYVSMYDPASKFLIRSTTIGEVLGVTGLGIRTNGGSAAATQVSISGYNSSNVVVGTKNGVAVSTTLTAIDLTSGITGTFDNIVRFRIQPNNDHFCLTSVTFTSPPTVTDARISISGASGTGGAYRVGDTITATWNNTAGGDNNTGITGVTVNFSQFGGGAAVVATNSSNTWTATYTITAGAIDTTNRNISVTATNSAGNTTTADTTNATVDNISPTVTDGRISISGASGTSGAYKIGDTVTATWNNTAGGDNNSDTISGVTVNFSQFGGGAAVAATNSSGTWTATYTIVSGAIDATSRNVSVTATDNAGNGTTTADTTNATVDSIAPTVTDGRISISGASGPGGSYVTGDTVTATWNNTAGGDNNSDTVSSVTVNFTAFGGGAAVAASNSSSTWTATYTIIPGAINATNRNVSVTATDNAGNATTTADTTNATVNNVVPAVTDANISISGASGTGGAYKIGDTVTATWNNTAGGDNNAGITGVTVDFSQFGGGAAVVATNSSNTWTATYTIVAGAIDATSRNVSVTATNAAGDTTTADTTNATMDNIAPTATDARISISGASGTAGAYKIGDTVTATWNNTAGGDNNSDTISSVTVDFSQFGGSAAVAASNSSGTWTATYTIVSGAIDTTSRNVSVTATDNAGNGTTTADTTNATVDSIAPTVTDARISISGASGTGGAFVTGDTVTASWNNTAGGDNNSDTISGVTVNFSQFGGGAAVAATNSSGTWTATYTIVSGAIDATNRNVSVTATDNAGNATTTADTTNATVDNAGPTVTDARISISGASGTGGTYKIGDTVTASWNNTAGGDNNSDTISSVTVNFTAFGGSAAVAASNSSGTWTATYTIVSGAIDATNQNVSVTAIDNAGNATTTADTTNATVDNIAPTVTDAAISTNGGNGTGGIFRYFDTVMVSWDNSVAGDNNSDTIASVAVDFSDFGGSPAEGASETGDIWSAGHFVGSGEGTDLNPIVTVADNAGNTATVVNTPGVDMDGDRPIVTDANISISGASGNGGAFVAGDTVTATWNDTAGGDNNSDTISSVSVDFSEFGGGSAVAASNSSDTWTANYTIVPGSIDDTNLNVSITVNDDAANAITVADTANATVDSEAAAVTSVNLPANGTYISGNDLDFIVNYSEAVTVDTSGGTPRLTLTIGAATRNANYQSGSGSTALLFRYTVQAGDNDGDGIALNGTLQTNGGMLRDDAGNSAGTGLGATGSLASVLVDTQAPGVDSVTLPANDAYPAGQDLNFVVNYDEAVAVNTTGGTPRLALTIGTSTVFASYVSGSGSTALLFRYTVQAGDADNDGIALSATLQANGGTLQDSAGNNASTSLGAIGSLAAVLVDTNAPSISSVILPADGTYIGGQDLDFTVNYDEAVTVNTAGGTPRLALTVGATARFASYLGGSGGTTLTFRHTAQAGDFDNDGIALNGTLQTNGGTIRDTVGNDAATSLGAIGSLAGVLVDADVPAVVSVVLPANGTYITGEDLEFTVNYDEAVTVITGLGTPRLALTIGSSPRFASYISGSGSMALLFRHTVQAGDSDSDGIALSSTLQSNGGALRDASNNDASTALGAIGSLAGVLVDAEAPSVSSVILPASGTYIAGDLLNFTVNYDEAVTVDTSGGTPALELTIGAGTRSASYLSGSGNTALLFRYTVQNTDNDIDGIMLNTELQANGATLRDTIGNNASTDLGSIASLTGVLVDTQAPDITTNAALNVAAADTATVGNTRLAASDNVSGAAEVVFTLASVPANGTLSLDSNALSGGGSFTQDDIDNGLLSYQHDGSQTTSDSFTFEVRDDAGNVNDNGGGDFTFDFTIAAGEEPVISAPADLDIDATELFTTVTLRQLLGLAANASDADIQTARLALASDSADGADCCNPAALELSSGIIRLAPGAHTITWRATDSDNNTAEDTQAVNVHPLISFAKDQVGVEGGQVDLRIILNGLSPVYPLDVPYEVDIAGGSVDGSDHDLVDGQVQFTAGQTERSVTVNLAGGDGAEGDETLVVRLGSGINAGATDSHRITITEGNVAPTVSLLLEQNGVDTALVTPTGGAVTVMTIFDDQNADLPTAYDWSLSDTELADTDGNVTDGVFEFDPSMLNEGALRLHVAVGDGAATTTAALSFRIMAALPVLGTGDADEDGQNDQTEGAGDSDGDGIADYLDNIAASNVLPETAAQTDAYLMECDPGVRCRLGQRALLASGGGARLINSDISMQDAIEADDGYAHTGGIFDFEARELPVHGQSVRVAIPLRAAIPAGAVYRKFQSGQWSTFVENSANALHSAQGGTGYCPPPGDAAWQSGLRTGYRCIQLTIEDGGPNDADGDANGSVDDPGSVATLAVDDEIVVRGTVKGGGSSDGYFLLVLTLLALLRGRRVGKGVAGALLLLLLPVQAQALDWKALLADSYIELGFSQAEGSRGRGELAVGLAADGVTAGIQAYDVSRGAAQFHIGYQYHENLGVRLGYLDLGDVEAEVTASAASDEILSAAFARHYPVSADGFVLAHRYEYPLRERLGLSVDAGFYIWESEISLSDSNGRHIGTNDRNDTDPILGLGASYRIDDRYTAGLNWQRVLFSNQEVDLWGLSGVFHF